MSTFFTSDPHFGHRMVAGHRGFTGLDEQPDAPAHDEAICDRWASQIKSDKDIVWVLGDLTMNCPTHALELLSRLPGRKRLITGNHDVVHPMHFHKAVRWMPDFYRVFEYVAPFAQYQVDGRRVLLSHFPYDRDRGEVRYAQYRLPDLGMPLLHGHTHGAEQLVISRDTGRVEVHVGLDAWDLRPVRDTEVADLLDQARLLLEKNP